MLHTRKRLVLPCALDDWIGQALKYPGVRLLPLTCSTAIDGCRLPGEFHKDPADRMLVAAARELGATLVTADKKILQYDHVTTIHPDGLCAGSS